MASAGLLPPPPFLASPGTPDDGRTWNASQLSAVPHEAVHEETGGTTRTAVGGHGDRRVGRKRHSTKTALEGKEPHDPKYPNTGSCTVSGGGGSALPPHTPSPPRPPQTENTTAGLGADRADEPEVVHQPEEQPVPLRRSTRERRPPERLGDYVQ
ncbi:hypothetical protein MRX96_058866 [Rhipicephalus microplus]